MNTIQHIKGDTFQGAIITLEALTTEDFTLVGAALKMELRQLNKIGTVSLTLTDGNGLTITGDKELEIDRQIIDIPAVVHYSDLQVTLANGQVYTPLEIQWQILQDVTQ